MANAFENPRKPGDNNKEKQDRSREIFQLEFEGMILRSKRMDEGAEGVIASVDLSKMTAEFLQAFNIEEAEESALKMLKVYEPPKGRNEYERQLAAYEAVKDLEGGAKVPRPYLATDIELSSEEVKQKLQIEFPNVKAEKQVEMMLMDLVDGDDLAKRMYKEVILRDKRRLVHLHQRVDEMRFEDLAQRVQEHLKFDRPGGKGKTLAERQHEEQEVYKKNAELLYEDLRKKDFALDPEIRKKVEITLKALHEKGIYHRDLHPRNIMLGNDGEVYLIDFGKSHVPSVDGDLRGDSPYAIEEGKEYLQDESLLNILQKLEGDLWKKAASQIEEINERELDDTVKYQLDRIKELLDEGRFELTSQKLKTVFDNVVLGVSQTEKRLPNQMAAALAVASWGEAHRDTVAEYLEHKAGELSGDEKKMVKSVLEKIKSA